MEWGCVCGLPRHGWSTVWDFGVGSLVPPSSVHIRHEHVRKHKSLKPKV